MQITKFFIKYAYETVPRHAVVLFLSDATAKSDSTTGGASSVTIQPLAGQLSYYSATGGAGPIPIQPLAGQAQLLFSHWRGSSVTIQPLAAQSFSVASLSPL